MNINDPINHEAKLVLDQKTLDQMVEKRRPNRPHYKELFESLSHSYRILMRCVVALVVGLFMSLVLCSILWMSLHEANKTIKQLKSIIELQKK
jgi:hypothetical protein